MDRICPFLALSDDARTVADGFDPAHRCHALTPPVALERQRQVQLCLTEAHARCERFTGARTALLAASSGLPRVAADVAFLRTRMVVDPEPAWRGLGGAANRRPPRAVLLSAIAAVAVIAVVLVGSLLRGGAEPGPSASPTGSEQISSSQAATRTGAPSASAALTPSAVPTSSATPEATQRTYIVQAGDTLFEIAQAFGTTVEAIMAANDLADANDLSVGQVLVIP